MRNALSVPASFVQTLRRNRVTFNYRCIREFTDVSAIITLVQITRLYLLPPPLNSSVNERMNERLQLWMTN